MDSQIAARLIAINREFYDRFGESFSATRHRLQPGVRDVLEKLNRDDSILDLGCGNGEFARALSKRRQRGAYLGLDFSPALLKETQSLPIAFPARFLQADILQLSELSARLARKDGWSVVTAFAVLHHIPGNVLRVNLLKTVRELLKQGGLFIHSNWQFLNSEKLKARIQPWEGVSIRPSELDSGDYLLDWRARGRGIRYVHHFSEQELVQLALQSGFSLRESFYSDGEGGKLGLYQVWEKT